MSPVVADPKAPLDASSGTGPEEPGRFVALFMKLPKCPFLWFPLEFLFRVANFFERIRGLVTPVPSPFGPQVLVEAKLPMRERAWAPQPQDGLPGAPPAPASVRPGRRVVRGGRPRLEGAKPGFTRCPSAPTKAHEGPLVGTLENSPVSGALPPARVPRAPATPLSAQTRRHSRATKGLHPSLLETYIVLGDEKVLGPSGADLVEKRLPRAQEGLSFPETPSLPGVTPRLHRRLLFHGTCQDLVIILPNSRSTEQ